MPERRLLAAQAEISQCYSVQKSVSGQSSFALTGQVSRESGQHHRRARPNRGHSVAGHSTTIRARHFWRTEPVQIVCMQPINAYLSCATGPPGLAQGAVRRLPNESCESCNDLVAAMC